MRLSEFILENMDAILQQWEDFARSLRPGGGMSIEALRNDAERMLRFVAADIESEQSAQEEVAKSRGHGPALPAGQPSAAHDHGVARAVDRFSLAELVSEYRALRASVMRMWVQAVPLTHDSVAQIFRFNEAIDQILAEAVATFTERLDHDADLFTGSIGHDLSNPVNSVSMSAHVLSSSRNLSPLEREAVARIERAVTRLAGMLSDLRDFTRTRLGGLVVLTPQTCDVGVIVRNVVEELAAVHPNRRIAVQCQGDLAARVDVKRIAQLISNLVANALQHGAPGSDVAVSVQGAGDEVTIGVHNVGAAIEPRAMQTMFDPLSRRSNGNNDRLGLGLYIAHRIALAHGGSIEVSSTPETGTRFTVPLPRDTAPSGD